MKIQYLLLENFAIVKSGMGLNKLELDFRKFKNVVTLIVGNNGTGKTGGVLCNLHPFAGLGHLEARDDSDIIIPEKDGHKVIIFKSKKHEYYIEHFYQYVSKRSSRKISSYCKKDGVELNPNGNVSSFIQIIEAEFKIDMNFLKLMRLGPNVKNFIGLTATERKSFIANLLAEVETYMRDYKQVSDVSNLLKNELKIALDKKNKLGVEDLTVLQDSIVNKQKMLDELRNSKEVVIKEFYEYRGHIDISKFDTIEQDIYEAKETISENIKALNKLKQPKYLHIETDLDMYKAYMDELKSINKKQVQNTLKIATINSEISSYNDKHTNLKREMDNTVITNEEVELKEYIKSLKEDIKFYEKNFDTTKRIEIPKAELLSDIDKINIIASTIDNVLALPPYVIDYFTNHFDKYGNDLSKMDRWAIKHRDEVSLELQQYNNDTKKNKNEMLHTLFTPSKCTCYNECPYYLTFEDNKHTKKSKERKAELKMELECLEGISFIAGALHSIRRTLAMRNADAITEYHIDESNVFESIFHKDKIFLIDPAKLQTLLEKIEYQYEYENNLKKVHESEMKLELLQAKHSTRDYQTMVDEEASLLLELDKLKYKLHEYENEREIINQKIHAAEEIIEDYSDSITYNSKCSEYNKLISEAQDKLKKLLVIQEEKSNFKTTEKQYDGRIQLLENQIKSEENEIYILKSKEATFTELQNEIKHVEEFYDYSLLIKDAVSSKSGIPKVYISFYCKALKTIANSIIKDIYDGELILRDFEITDTKFNIPYYTKGTNVDDIRYASQAEASVATVAISFAILMQFMPKYNVILLDEIDGPLHQNNKEKLFASLEGELSALGCEQVFMITQSKMYNDYPVNLIITDPEYANMVTDKSKVIFQR